MSEAIEVLGPRRDVSVYLIDDHSVARAGLHALLQQRGESNVVGSCSSIADALEPIARLHPELVILDIASSGMSGLEAVPRVLATSQGTRVLVMAEHEGVCLVGAALNAGAAGVVAKSGEPDELFSAMRTVLDGGTHVPSGCESSLDATRASRRTVRAVNHGGVESLTAREREVFLLLAVGHSNKDVARRLFVSVGTVKKHRENLQRKLDCHSGACLARLAIREGLVSV